MYLPPAVAAARHELTNPRSRLSDIRIRDPFLWIIYPAAAGVRADSQFSCPVLMRSASPNDQIAILHGQLSNPRSRWYGPGLRNLVQGPIQSYLYGFQPRDLEPPRMPLDRQVCLEVRHGALFIRNDGIATPLIIKNLPEYRLEHAYTSYSFIHVIVFAKGYYEITINEDILRGFRNKPNCGGVVEMPRGTPIILRASLKQQPASYPISPCGSIRRHDQTFFGPDCVPHTVPAGSNPYYEAPYWYNLDAAGIWSRVRPSCRPEFLIGPHEWM